MGNGNASLQRKFIIIISSAIIITIVIGTLFYSYFSYKAKIKLFNNSNIKTIKNVYPFYSNYLWQMDKRSIINVSKSLLSMNGNLCAISVLDENNKLIFRGTKKNAKCSGTQLMSFNKKVKFKNEYIGRIKFSFSKYNINKSIKNIVVFNVFLGLIISLIVIIIISIIFKNLFSAPLMRIVSDLQKVASGNYNIKHEEYKYEEINNIIKSLNKMIYEIKLRDKRNIDLTESLNNLINNMPGGLIITDEEGNLLKINNSLCEQLKMDKNDIIPKNFISLSSKQFTKKFLSEKLEKIKEKRYEEFEWELADAEKNYFPVLVKGKKIKLQDKNEIIFSITNIQYIKQLEKEVRLKEQLESLGILAGGIAHDFNNILTAIGGGIEIIEILISNKEFDKAEERLKKILKSLETAKYLTHQLLTFSKGRAPLKKAFFELEDLIKDTALFILSGSGVELEFQFDEKLHPVKIDPNQISQVIQNIVLNAKQALKNTGKIIIKGLNCKDSIKILIRDNGPGIPNEIIDKIWQPYYTNKIEGNGLGLSIVYSIIKQHNGEIKIISKQGEFTEFEITLPAYIENEQSDNGENKHIENRERKNHKKKEIDFHKLNVLVMDDEKNIRETLKEMLETLGCKVQLAENGEKALDLYKNEKFNIVFLDLTVKGGMGGKKCIGKLLEIDKNVNAIVHSGYSEQDIMKNCRAFSFKSSLKKPFAIGNLKNAIQECLSKNMG